MARSGTGSTALHADATCMPEGLRAAVDWWSGISLVSARPLVGRSVTHCGGPTTGIASARREALRKRHWSDVTGTVCGALRGGATRPGRAGSRGLRGKSALSGGSAVGNVPVNPGFLTGSARFPPAADVARRAGPGSRVAGREDDRPARVAAPGATRRSPGGAACRGALSVGLRRRSAPPQFRSPEPGVPVA
jgi:hypothetical protein